MKKLLLLALPTAALAALAVAVFARKDPVRPLRAEKPAPVPQAVILPASEAPPPPPPAPDKAIAAAVEETSFRATYENYRSAVATGNEDLERALRPVLLRNRSVALRSAQEDLSRATEPVDREISEKTLEALKQ